MSHNKYIAILGRQPELGLAELEAVVGADQVVPFGRAAALVSSLVDIDRLGMTIKFTKVIYEGALTDLKELPIDIDQLPFGEGKSPFALSLYGVQASRRDCEAAGLALKKRFKQRGSVRLIQPVSGVAVTAAGLKHNKVLAKGFELLVVVNGSHMILATTVGVQDIDAYAARDYGRPARSAGVGMLPPKLAQFLLNMTPAGQMVADPFCGTGVVLQEALLAGRAAWGSDLEPDMVEMTRTNLQWLAQQYGEIPDWNIQVADARNVTLPVGAAVVSEGYLGPALAVAPGLDQLREIKQQTAQLYREVLKNWASQLPTGATVALCSPSWRLNGTWHHLGIIDELPKMGYSLMEFAHATTPLLYARPDQIVGRRLLLMRKS